MLDVNVYSPLIKTPSFITFKDFDGIQSSNFYVKPTMCNLNCYHCHNKHGYKNEPFLTWNELQKKLSMLSMMKVECVIVSGGEPTLLPWKTLEKLFEFIRENFSGIIRLDTNGTNPEVIQKLFDFQLIDSVAIDIKIPLDVEIDETNLSRYSMILFSKPAVEKEIIQNYQKKVSQSIDIAEYYSDINLYRTVKYPFFTNDDLNRIKEFVNQLGLKHQFNEFVPVKGK